MSAVKLLKRFSLAGVSNLTNLRKGSEIRVVGKELRHLRASRVNPNEFVELFDSNGAIVTAMVKSIDSSSSTLSVTKVQTMADSQASTHLTLAVGMPKGPRSDWLVEKVTEVGVSALIPLESDHTLLKVKDPKMERWERLMIQASKQSHTRTPPMLRERMDMNELLNEEIQNYDAIVWGCMPQERNFRPTPLLELRLPTRPLNALLIIGPEGDLSTSEKQKIAAAHGIAVTLSSNRLRTETAAVIMTSIAHMLFNRDNL